MSVYRLEVSVTLTPNEAGYLPAAPLALVRHTELVDGGADPGAALNIALGMRLGMISSEAGHQVDEALNAADDAAAHTPDRQDA